MKIGIIGTGYVGLVTGTCFAEVGNVVTCIDKDAQKIERLKKGEIPIFEPGLEPLVKKNEKEGRLLFSTSLADTLNKCDLLFIAVGTPPNEDGSADLSHVLGVAEEICQHATKEVIVATKSTVPVGTGDKIEALFKAKLKVPSVVFSNPEFLKEGDAVSDFMKPDRVVIGVNTDSINEKLKELYAPFTRKSDRLIFMNRRSAELTKYAANAMLATRISFMNEIANLCEKVGADVGDIRRGIGSDPRIGSEFLFPGLGYGGSCFPKDVKAILKTASDYNSQLSVVNAVEVANAYQKKQLFEKINTHFKGQLKGKTFALWGLAFKARTDDIRESPALVLADQLLAAGAQVKCFDPEAMNNVRSLYADKLTYCEHSYDCLDQADGLVIATEWNEFRSPDLERIKATLKEAVIFDGRNLLNRAHLKNLGFTYYSIGQLYS